MLRSLIDWKANDPSEIIFWHLVEGGEWATNGHDQGEEEEEEVVDGGDEAEGGGGECREEREVVESESESEVSEDSESEEKRWWTKCGVLVPLEMGDGWMID